MRVVNIRGQTARISSQSLEAVSRSALSTNTAVHDLPLHPSLPTLQCHGNKPWTLDVRNLAYGWQDFIPARHFSCVRVSLFGSGLKKIYVEML